MRPTNEKTNGGMALLLAVFFIGVAVVVTGALMGRIYQQRTAVTHFEDYNAALFGLDAAISRSEAKLEAGEDGSIGMEDWEPVWNERNELVLPDFDSDAISPQRLPSMESVEYAAYAHAWEDDGRDNNGNGLADDASEEGMYTVYAMARSGAAVRRAEAVYKTDNVNAWQNAIFAGPGLSGGLINGSVNAAGSVHMLGDGLLDGAIGLATLGLGGTTRVRNNYTGIPDALLRHIPDPPQTLFEGEIVSTLRATFRSRNGLINLTADSALGDAQAFGNAVKETLDAVFVTGGWIGGGVLPDGDRGEPQNVHSDNGWDELYDLADRVVFPRLSDPFQDAQGRQVARGDTGDPYKHEEYFAEVLVGDPEIPNDGIYTGNITFDTAGAHFYWNATTGEQMSGSLPAVSPPKTDDYVLFNRDRDVLEINGQIYVTGNVNFRGKGSQKSLYYTGRGAILAGGSVQIDSHLLACNGGDPSDLEGSFPVENAIGIMARENIVIGGSLLDLIFRSDIHLMGAFYAGRRVTSLKTAKVAGTIVSNYFDLTLNPPTVYQVPELGRNLPEGMVGDYPIIAATQISWRELGL
ncbi:MAG: hypothetical protein KF886_21405 [Candidatus Hydrogenedentes bacterium]|nr:hypothetical protein [Candidatus Hydrogenedentota bacterium]